VKLRWRQRNLSFASFTLDPSLTRSALFDMTAKEAMLATVTLTQEVRDGAYGCEHSYIVVKSKGACELTHDYCTYHPMAGPVRPDTVEHLRLEGDVVKWSWSENAFDLASTGADFERRLTLDGRGALKWASPAQRTPKVRLKAVPPSVSQSACTTGLALCRADVQVDSKWWRDYDDHVAIHITHTPSKAVLVWDGDSTAENQSITGLKQDFVDGLLHIQFAYRTSENGNHFASNRDLYVRFGCKGLEFVK